MLEEGWKKGRKSCDRRRRAEGGNLRSSSRAI